MQLDPKGLEAAKGVMRSGSGILIMGEAFDATMDCAIRAYLEATPSPSPAPGVVTDAMVEAASAKYREIGARCNWQHSWPSEEAFRAALTAAIGAGGQAVAHPDDLAVDRFAVAMKAKLAKKRAEGRGGWDNRDECTAEHLSYLLVQHIIKGDPLDVGNLAMMLHQRGDRIIIDDETRVIAAALSQPHPADEREVEALEVTVPKEPSRGRLISMATRYNHAFLINPGPNAAWSSGVKPENREAILRSMRQLYEEAIGEGFYSPDREDGYVASFEKAQASAQEGRNG